MPRLRLRNSSSASKAASSDVGHPVTSSTQPCRMRRMTAERSSASSAPSHEPALGPRADRPARRDPPQQLAALLERLQRGPQRRLDALPCASIVRRASRVGSGARWPRTELPPADAVEDGCPIRGRRPGRHRRAAEDDRERARRHAGHERVVGVLHDHVAAGCGRRRAPGRAVVERAGQHHGDGRGAPGPRERAEHRVGRGPHAVLLRAGARARSRSARTSRCRSAGAT